MTWRNRMAGAGLTAVLVVGCTPSTQPEPRAPGAGAASTATTVAAHGVEAAIGSIPWSQVGPGWLLATWSAAPGRGSGEPPPGQPTAGSVPTSLYLVDPNGGRYPIATFPPSGDGPTMTLGDWSGDGSHALLYANTAAGLAITTVDLHSGRQAIFTVDGSTVIPQYSRPLGKAIVLTKGHDTEPASLRRVDLAGKPELTYPVGPEFRGSFLSTPDGTRLILGTAAGLALMGNDGVAGRALPVPGGHDCAPARWWDAGSTVVLTRCLDRYLPRLWLVPANGEPVTALTAPLTGQDQDLGDVNAWQLPAGIFVQDEGACGSEYLGKLSRVGGTTTPVSVPEVAPHSSVHVVGVNGSHLHLQATVSCGSGESLIDYDPGANASTVLLGPPLNGGGVIAAVPYPGRG